MVEVKSVEQMKQLENPDARVAFGEAEGALLRAYGNAWQGIASSDYPRFGANFWELKNIDEKSGWVFHQSTTNSNIFYGELAPSPSASAPRSQGPTQYHHDISGN